MAQGIGEVLTFAVGVTISPVPIIAVILMLFSGRAKVNGPMFLAGWVVALTVVSSAAYLLSDAGNASTDSARLGRPAVLFVGWFGPRGLASVVFGLLALENLAGSAAKQVTTVIAFTVLLSVLAHGLSADPLARRYGPRLTPPPGTGSPAGLAEIPERRLIRRPRPPPGRQNKEIADDNRSDPDRGRPRRRIAAPPPMPAN